MEKRKFIAQKILLRVDNQTKIFYVKRKIAEGGSVLCYEGHFKSSTGGTLREFYPENLSNFLARDEDEQLIFKNVDAAAKNLFLTQLENYLQPYYKLLEEQNENAELATFIPNFEIYFGAENAAGTAYIWTPEPKLETFEKFCAKVHKRPAVKPEKNLLLILQAVISLTKCVCALHRAGLIHRDIKPANFGFKKLSGEILPQNISLFDINTICSIYENFESSVASEGYSEPEIFSEPANNLTDIFSIGATLFSAITFLTYDEKNFGNLKNLVDKSKLIAASEINSHPKLRATLTEILQKTLCRREGRFENCETLSEELEKARYYLLPAEFSQKNLHGEKWILNAEKSFDKLKEKNSARAIQYHLYQYPLYKKLAADEKILNVLILGFGNYGQKFLDSALQAGQMVNKNFKAVIVSDSAADKEIYLNERPALKDFFSIDGEKAAPNYGELSFKVKKIFKSETAADSDAVDDLILELCETARPHYIFIALGNDALNKNTALACQKALKSLEINSLVNFAVEENLSIKPRGIIPVHVRQNVKDSPLYSEIERMAFNAHLVWEKNLNVDFKKFKKDFQNPYNHYSSVSNVLSIKYKLFSIGIDIDKSGGLSAAAKIFVERQLHRDGKKNSAEYNLRNELIFVEHKRWVVEKICAGYQKRNLQDCADGTTKDEENKNHVCILTSRPARLLDNYAPEDWDNLPQSELDKLDELDKMTVQLHQLFLKRANESKIAWKDLAEKIRAAIYQNSADLNNKACFNAFVEFQACLNDIQNGDRNKVRLYKNLKSNFENTLEKINPVTQDEIKSILKALEGLFTPVLNRMQYKDYKQLDTALIDGLPFILTYSEKLAQVIPYKFDAKIFDNVAAATVINPAKIFYLVLCENKNDILQFKNSLQGLFAYARRKNLQAEFEFAIACNLKSSERAKFAADIQALYKKIKCVKIFQLDSKIDTQKIIAFFQKYLRRKNNFLLEKNDSPLSKLLEGGNVYAAFDSYEFDAPAMHFKSFKNCEFLNYINKQNFINVNDLTALNNSGGVIGVQPDFFEDYKILWKKYRESSEVWKRLCELLGSHAEKFDILANLNQLPNHKKLNSAREYIYILPLECYQTADKILNFLLEKDVAEKGSCLRIRSANSFEVIVKDKCNNEKQYKKIFANPYALFQADAIQLKIKANAVSIIFDGLTVKNLNLSNENSKVLNLLQYFAEKNYLTNLNSDNFAQISFTYATRTIKNLLTVAGKILEIYVWHEIKSSGYFDDVVTSFEPNWKNSDPKNEIDCIAVKNFKTLIIECKARHNIEQDFYFKLHAISEQFGVNATAVLIADTQEKEIAAANNEIQRVRGDALKIVTVYEKEKIDNIAATLRKIISAKNF